MTKSNGLMNRVFRWLIQYLNIFLFACGRVAVVVIVILDLITIFHPLYWVQDQLVRLTFLQVVLGAVVAILILTIPVYVLAHKAKCKVPRIKKGVRSYLLVEHYTVFVFWIITGTLINAFENVPETYYRSDPITTISFISWCTIVICLIQRVLWSSGSDVVDGPYLPLDD